MENRRVLLVVDAQNDVIDASIRRDSVVGNIASLVEQARGAGVPVVWVRHTDEEEGLRGGAPGWEIVEELRPAEGEPIVDKRYGDSFADTNLRELLQELGAEELVLCGAQTDACIRSTFYGAIYRGYRTTLVTDAHTTEDMRPWGAQFSPEQAIEMFNLHAKYTLLPDVRGAVTTTADAFADTARDGW